MLEVTNAALLNINLILHAFLLLHSSGCYRLSNCTSPEVLVRNPSRAQHWQLSSSVTSIGDWGPVFAAASTRIGTA